MSITNTSIRKSKRNRVPSKYMNYELTPSPLINAAPDALLPQPCQENELSLRNRVNLQLGGNSISNAPIKLVIQTKHPTQLKLVTSPLQECQPPDNKPKINKLIILKNETSSELTSKSVTSFGGPATPADPTAETHLYKCYQEDDHSSPKMNVGVAISTSPNPSKINIDSSKVKVQVNTKIMDSNDTVGGGGDSTKMNHVSQTNSKLKVSPKMNSNNKTTELMNVYNKDVDRMNANNNKKSQQLNLNNIKIEQLNTNNQIKDNQVINSPKIKVNNSPDTKINIQISTINNTSNNITEKTSNKRKHPTTIQSYKTTSSNNSRGSSSSSSGVATTSTAISSKLIRTKVIKVTKDRNCASSRMARMNNECRRLQSTPEYCDNTRCDREGNPVIIGRSGLIMRSSERRRSDRRTTAATSASRTGQDNATYYMEIAVRKQLLTSHPQDSMDPLAEDASSPYIAYTQIMLSSRSRETPNGLNTVAIYEIIDALEKGENDSSRILVLTALTGYNQIWCGGFDTNYFISKGGGNKADLNLIVELNKAVKCLVKVILKLSKPLVVVVNGECKGIGFAIALLADIVFASDKSSFCTRTALYFDNGGNVPECIMGMSKTLSEAVGSRLATDMFLSGRKLSAQQAVEYGFISRTLWHTANVMQNIAHYVQTMAKNQIQAMQSLKQLMASPTKKADILQAVDLECTLFTKHMTSDWFKAFRKHIKDEKPTFSFLSK